MAPARKTQSPAHRPHDHTDCLARALAAAEEASARRRLRLTPLRRLVLEIVARSHRPMGAYQVLAELAARDPARPRVAPPTVYRALDFLIAEGFVHRLDSLNAFVACFSPGQPHKAYFFVCEHCGRAGEIESPALAGALKAAASQAGFAAARETVEIAGRCAACRG